MSAATIGGASLVGSQQMRGNQFAGIETEDFIRVLISELANQDPFDPQDSAALLEQLSSIRNIESQLVLQEKLETLVLQNQVFVAGNLIGRMVTGLDDRNDMVKGLVQSVRVQDGRSVLELDSGASLEMDRVTRIDAVEPAGN